MRAEAAVGVERERAAVEDELVLAADHVEIDEREAALDHPRDRDVLADGELVALIRRGVGNEQDLAAGFEDAFDRVRPPDVLADRNPDPDAAKHDRPRRRPGRKHPLLVEDAVVGQIDLEPDRLDPPADRAAPWRCKACRPRPRAGPPAPPARRRRCRGQALPPPRGKPPGTRASAPGPRADSRRGRVPAPSRCRPRTPQPPRALCATGRGSPRCRRRSRGFARAR